MNVTSYRYYKLNYEILKFLRVWNTEPATPEILVRLIVLYCFVMCTFFQVAALCTTRYTLQEMSRTWIFIHATVTLFNKYLMLYVEMKKVKYLFARIEQDWNTLQVADEYNILKEYTVNSKLMLNVYILFSIPLGAALILYGNAPIILDIVVPLNESRPRRFMFIAEFFIIDPVKYFVLINVFVTIITVAGIMIVIVADGSVVMFAMHNCAMFKIAGYRLQRAIDTKEKLLFRTRLISAVLTHQGAIEFADMQQEICSIFFYFFLLSGTCSTTMTIYSLSQAIKVTKNTRDIMAAFYSIVFQFSYIYLGNHVSQTLIDHSSEIFTVTYNTQWYSMPTPAQKLIILILRRSMKSCAITLGKVYQPSCVGFTTICNMSMSYLTFMYSI